MAELSAIQIANTNFISNPAVVQERMRLVVMCAIAGTAVVTKHLAEYGSVQGAPTSQDYNSQKLAHDLFEESQRMGDAALTLRDNPTDDRIPATWRRALYAISLDPQNTGNLLSALVPTDQEYNDFVTALSTGADFAATPYGVKLSTVLDMADTSWQFAADSIYGIYQLERKLFGPSAA